MSNRNSGFGENPGYDLCTDVAMVENGHLPFAGARPSGQPDDFDEIDPYAEGDKNVDYCDRTYVHGATHDTGITYEDAEDDFQNYLFERLAEEQAIEAAKAREKQMLEAYYDAERVPFFMYQHNRGVSQHAVETRSEALAVATGRSVKKGEATSRKHQQFYGNLRIH